MPARLPQPLKHLEAGARHTWRVWVLDVARLMCGPCKLRALCWGPAEHQRERPGRSPVPHEAPSPCTPQSPAARGRAGGPTTGHSPGQVLPRGSPQGPQPWGMLHLRRVTAPDEPASVVPGPSSCLPPQGNSRGHEPPRGCNSLPGCKQAPNVLYNLLVAPRKEPHPHPAPGQPWAPGGPAIWHPGQGQAGRPGPATWSPEPVYTAFWVTNGRS